MIYDPDLGYCQGMSDLLSPIVSVIEDDYEAFWCFVGFMKKVRHNFRLDVLAINESTVATADCHFHFSHPCIYFEFPAGHFLECS